MPTTNKEFEDIRAYTDADLSWVLPLLLKDKKLFDTLARYRLQKLHGIFPGLSRLILRFILRRKLVGVNTIFGLQEKITGYYFFHMLESSVSDFSINGLENLPTSGGALLLSNHRDIVLDPAFVDYALYTKRKATARLATGDNLMDIPFAKHLMRLNKSFWVKRGETSPRRLLANLKTLSKYIRLSITEDKELVWMAQREGRAKDGRDKTEVAVLKMLRLADNKASWKDTCQQLNLIPVSISYEYDPCDIAKAEELATLSRTGEREKDDTASVVTGITKNKGNVAIHFGKPVEVTEDTEAEQLADIIDEQIITNYRLYPCNFTALQLLAEEIGEDYAASLKFFANKAQETDNNFIARIADIDDKLVRQLLLQMYANPCVELWKLQTTKSQITRQ